MLSAAEVSRSLKPLLLESRPGRARSFRRVATDSRQVQRGDLFVALPGEHEDGHSFVQEAVAGGAAGVIAEQMPVDLADGSLPTSCPIRWTLFNAWLPPEESASRWRSSA
jgi:UDP-N-acetylmuramyl pentapeptide synthase